MNRVLALVALVVSFQPAAHADQILVLSGGAAPIANHYSQYLQTKTLSDNLKTQTPGTAVTTYFGGGNAQGAKPVLADVHRSAKNAEGLNVETLLPGFIAGNKPATQKEIAAYFAQPSLSKMAKNETLFVFVSDHGMPQVLADGSMNSTFSDNCIDLWAFDADLSTEQYKMGTPQDRCLSQSKLKKTLDTKVSAGRVVYAMSQCYSGGFHKMSIKEVGGYPTAETRVCGFTAITEDETASGCTADVDGPGYQGYERSFTEQLTGIDVVSGKKLREPRASILEAHQAATLEDQAKDIPLSTSDFFLWKWALAFENKNSSAAAVVNAAMLGRDSLADKGYKTKEVFVYAMTEVFAKAYPADAAKLKGSIADLQELEATYASQLMLQQIELNRVGNALANAEVALLQRFNLHVQSGTSVLTPMESRLELNFFGALDQRFGYGAADQEALMQLSILSLTRPSDAAALADYKSKRAKYAQEWALGSGEPRLVSLANNILKMRPQVERGSEAYGDLQSAQGHARRLLIYRQALGAWQALAKMQNTKALAELAGLVSCESASLR